MFKFFLNDNRGAVTVIVTLLLIPAILISGTFVDLARLYAMRAELENASIQAASSKLAGYKNLMKDMYALYGFLKEEGDAELNAMMSEYIQASLIGEEGNNVFTNTFLFPGEGSLEIKKALASRPLRNPKVLRNQIEEYMKYRGPVIIVSKILEMFDSEENNDELIQDMKAITKLRSEQAVFDAYQKVIEETKNYASVVESYLTDVEVLFTTLNSFPKYMHKLHEELYKLQEIAIQNKDLPGSISYINQFNVVQEKASAIINSISFLSSQYESISSKIDQLKTKDAKLKASINSLDSSIAAFESELNSVGFSENSDVKKEKLKILGKIKEKKQEIERELDNNKNIQNISDFCEHVKVYVKDYSDVLFKNSSDIFSKYGEFYKFTYKIGDQNNDFSNVFTGEEGDSYSLKIDFHIPDLGQESNMRKIYTIDEKDVFYASGSQVFSFDEYLRNSYIASSKWKSYFEHKNQILNVDSPNIKFYASNLTSMVKTDNVDIYIMPGTEEKSGDKKNVEDRQKDNIFSYIDKFLGVFKSCFVHGDDVVKESPLSSSGKGKQDGAGNKTSEGLVTDMQNDMQGKSDMINIFEKKSIAAHIVSEGLQLFYATHMFSNFTTGLVYDDGKKDKEDKKEAPVIESLTGIPMGTESNYFFRSEWEYLFNGDKNSSNNLNKVVWSILLVRFLYNYVLSYSVVHVNTTVESILAIPVAGPFLAPLARAAFAFGESVYEVGTLRQGGEILFFKTGKDWYTSLEKITSDVVSLGDDDNSKKEDKRWKVNYSQHLFLLLLAFGPKGDAMTNRIGDLIELNLNNYKLGINGDGGTMASKYGGADWRRLEDLYTMIEVDSSANMNMLFLSLPIAKTFLKSGQSPVDKFPVSVKVRRSY